jgi:hypothetical protein
MIITESFGRIILLFRKALNKCIADYLYSSVNNCRDGFITAETTLIHPENIYLGNRSYVNGGMLAASANAKIVIGDNCMISYCVHIRTDMHEYSNPNVPMIDQGHSEEDIITALLNSNADDKPTMIVPLKRLGIPVTLKALTGKQVFRVRERNTRTVERRNKIEKVLDTEGFNMGLIMASTVKPNWGAPELLNKFRASSGEEVLKRILLGGEISLLGDVVLEISGYNVGIDDIKNL